MSKDTANDLLIVQENNATLRRAAALAAIVVLVLALFGGLLYSCEMQRNRLNECTKTHPVAECREAYKP